MFLLINVNKIDSGEKNLRFLFDFFIFCAILWLWKFKEKLKMKNSKKILSQNEINLKTRSVWTFSPVERIKPSKKVYNRQKFKKGE